MREIWEKRREESRPKPEDARTPYDIDYGRVVHSASFRRLQGKTQILSLGDCDFYRTRLTHTLEVAQIAAGLVKLFETNHRTHAAVEYLPPTSLIQAIGFSHDLGHPPFGHGGEVALNYCMRDHGGFEGNGQTLRILSRLEKFSEKHGSNLTRRALLGVLKYPASYSQVVNPTIVACLDESPTSIQIIDRNKSKPPKCFLDSEQDVVDWILELLDDRDREHFQRLEKKVGKHSKPYQKSFDCSIMDIADDIAYGVHDLEDAIAIEAIKKDEFCEYVKNSDCQMFLGWLKTHYYDCANEPYNSVVNGLFKDSITRKRFIGMLVHFFMIGVEIDTRDHFKEPLIRYSACMKVEHRRLLNILQKLVNERVIQSPNVQHLEFKGLKMVVSVFEAFKSDPKAFLPRDTCKTYEADGQDIRVICDHIAGMTDGYLLKTYDRLFSPRMGSIFDKL